MKNKKTVDVWIISQVSAFLAEPVHTIQDGIGEWIFDDGSILWVDCENKEIKFVDWVGDMKTYFSIVGVAAMNNYSYNDYFTDSK
jgi:hypothetical protein